MEFKPDKKFNDDMAAIEKILIHTRIKIGESRVHYVFAVMVEGTDEGDPELCHIHGSGRIIDVIASIIQKLPPAIKKEDHQDN